jgi:hypothetical protein
MMDETMDAVIAAVLCRAGRARLIELLDAAARRDRRCTAADHRFAVLARLRTTPHRGAAQQFFEACR